MGDLTDTPVNVSTLLQCATGGTNVKDLQQCACKDGCKQIGFAYVL